MSDAGTIDPVLSGTDGEAAFADQAVAERLEWLRRYVGMSQKEFSESVGVLPSTYNNWRCSRQRLSLDGAKRIRTRYQVPLDFLFLADASTLPDRMRQAWEARP